MNLYEVNFIVNGWINAEGMDPEEAEQEAKEKIESILDEEGIAEYDVQPLDSVEVDK